jgi:uncharacterized protein (DUF433 family)
MTARIEVDPSMMLGKPVVRNTRILGYVGEGANEIHSHS